jgi:hypothetical protein
LDDLHQNVLEAPAFIEGMVPKLQVQLLGKPKEEGLHLPLHLPRSASPSWCSGTLLLHCGLISDIRDMLIF